MRIYYLSLCLFQFNYTMLDQKHLPNEKILTKQMVYDLKSKEILDKTLQFSGLKLGEQIDYRSVRISEIDHIHEIYTMNQKKNLPHIVLLHGFGGTGMTYFRMFKHLQPHYQIHALDAMGVGHSSKGNFKQSFTYEETKDYFIDAIQEWRKSVGIKNFTLVGHSFGGYLAVCYTEKYKDHVDRLILLSPAGATDKTPEQVQIQMNKRKQGGFKTKFFYFCAEKVFNWRIRPSKIMGNFFLGEKFINKIVDTRLKLQDEQNQAWKVYFRDLSRKQAVGQIGFYIIFQFPLKPKHTIQSMINRMNFKKPIQFYYGENDWMDSKGAYRLHQKLDNVNIERITAADHQLIFDNPQQICYHILIRK